MPHLKISRALERLVTTPKSIKVAIGGRGSGKSIGVADIMVMKMDTERADVYCLREFQDSIADSVHKVLKGSIEKRLGLTGWDIQEKTIIAPNGAKTTYKGANRNPDSMQSAQDYKYSFFEEAHRASKDSLDKLLPTIIRNPGAECWFAGNPQSSADPFSQRFIVPYQEALDRDGFYEDDLHLIVVMNWRDNPWWNEEQERLRSWDYENRPRAEYDWIWEGKFNDTVENALVKPEWFDACIDAHKLDRLASSFKPYGSRIAALDPFDDGGDAAGYAVRHASIIEAVRQKTTGEIDAVCDWGMDLADAAGANWFVWDGDGMGAGLKGQIKRRLDGSGVGYHMFRGSLGGAAQDRADSPYAPLGDDGTSSNNESVEGKRQPKTFARTFKNNRAQYYKTLAERMFNTWRCVVRGEYVDPDVMLSIASDGVENMQQLRAEVCRVPVKPNANGLIQIMSKEDMRRQSPPIASPNMADAVMMTMVSPAEMSAETETYVATGGAGAWMG